MVRRANRLTWFPFFAPWQTAGYPIGFAPTRQGNGSREASRTSAPGQKRGRACWAEPRENQLPPLTASVPCPLPLRFIYPHRFSSHSFLFSLFPYFSASSSLVVLLPRVPSEAFSLSLSLQPPPPPIRNPPLDNLTVKCARTASPRRGGTRTTTLVVPSRRFTSIHHGLSTFVPTFASLSRSFSYARPLFQAEAYVTRSCRINSSLDVWRNGMHVAGI